MAILSKVARLTKNLGDKTESADEINGIYAKIGEYYYQLHKSGASLPEEVAAHCAVIDEHNKAIEEANAEAARAAGGIVCPSCSKANPPGTKFCRECGAKLPEEAPAPKSGVCPSCSKVNAPGTKFCSECGAKLPEEAPAAPKEGVCPSCGNANAPGTKFCRECGAKLS